MPLAALNTLKEQAVTYRPTLLCDITFASGAVLRLATITCTYGGNSYLGRLSAQSISAVQALSEQGIDRVPSLSLQIDDPDATLWTNYERVYGFTGATITCTFVFYDVATVAFSSDAAVVFNGVCNKPRFDLKGLSLSALNKANLQKVQLPQFPIQRRCANINPTTVEQRAEANNEDSPYYACGATGTLVAEPPCSNTKQTCTRLTHFSGITYQPPSGGRSREYTTGSWIEIKSSNQSPYGDFYPVVYGTCWVQPPVINVFGDANYTRGELVAMAGEATNVQRVIVNDVELSPATAMDGTPYSFVNKDFRFHILNAGDRDGAPNADVPYNGQGDPYGNLCAVYWVVPRKVADSSGVPNVKVLLQGKKIRVYSDAVTYSRIYSDNPVWILMDILAMTSYDYADLDIQSFLDAAAICDGNVTYTDQNGGSSVHKRFSCSLVLRQRRSAADIVRGLRLGNGMLLVPNTAGKLAVKMKGTLAEQQPSAVAGSNYNTAIASKNRAGTTTNGYAAYRFTASNILAPEGKSTLIRLDRDIQDIPNRVAFTFPDGDYGYAASSFAQIDSDARKRAGQEVSGGTVVEPLGVNSYDQANRIAKQLLDEALRGNPRGDADGTDFWQWQTSVKGLRLQLGQIVLLNDTRAGLSDAQIRLTRIQPSKDYQTILLEGHVHSDNWYLDSNGQAANPQFAGARRDTLDRPAYPWRPNKQAPITSDAYYGATDLNFALTPQIEYSADGTPIVKLLTAGVMPVNTFAGLRPPILGTQGTTATTGGSILGSGRVYHFVVCSEDASGNLSAPSQPCVIAVTSGTSTNTVTIPFLANDSTQTGYRVFGGEDPNAMCWQATGTGTPTSVTLTSIRARSYGVPDIEFDRLLIRLKRVRHSGILGTAAAAVSSTTITIGGTWTANQLAGYEISLLGKADNSTLPIANFSISANTTGGVLTVSPDPTTYVAVGDAVVVRSKPSVSAGTVTDANWVNPFATGGLTSNSLTGLILRIISGKGRGKSYTIASNTSTAITLVDSAPEMDSTSRYIVEEASWLPDQADSTTIDNADPAKEATFPIPTGNYQQQTLLVQAITMDGGNNEAFEALAPVRDIYQFGAPIVEANRSITSSTTMAKLDQVLTVDTTAGNVALTILPPASVAGQSILVKRKTAGSNTLTVAPSTGTIDGASSVSLPNTGDFIELYSDGTTWLKRSSTVSGGGGGTSADAAPYTITWASTITPDVNNGRYQKVTVTGNTTINFPTNAAAGQWFSLVLNIDATGGYSITLGTGWKLTGSEIVTLANTKTTILVRFDSTSAVGAVEGFTSGV